MVAPSYLRRFTAISPWMLELQLQKDIDVLKFIVYNLGLSKSTLADFGSLTNSY